MAYIADGNTIAAIDRGQFAQIDRQRLQLEGETADVQRKLLGHLAPTYLEHVREAQATLEKATKSPLNGDKDARDAATVEANTATLRQDLAAAVATYEASRKEFQTLTDRAATLRERLDSLTHDAVKWRVQTPHDSSMILAGQVLVVGGASQVAVFDAETGGLIESLAVDGEARGLAVADGRLYVSTTAGKVYGFAPSASSPKPLAEAGPAAVKDPYPHDELTELYATAAEQIIQRSNVTRGCCLIIGSRQGRLAYELAKRTALKIYCVEADRARVDESRGTGIDGPVRSPHYGGSHRPGQLSVSQFLCQSDRLRRLAVDRVRPRRSRAGGAPPET